MSKFRNRLLNTVGSGFEIVDIKNSIAGDTCMYDIEQNEYIIISGNFRYTDFPLEKYIPIGVVVVPGIHSVYGENTCGVISLSEMSCDTPTIGTVETTSMQFGVQVDLPTNNYNVVIIKDSDTLTTNGFGYLSKNGIYNSSTLKIPDPYNDDMSRNTDYYNKTISAYNAMSDFAGQNNTNIILGTRGVKNYTTWKPIASTSNNYPAASCCDMYSPNGTVQGQWYLPSAGEWGYVTSKWDIIQNSLDRIIVNYSNCMLLADNASYWTSSEHSGKNTRYVHTNNGMGHMTKTSTARVRSMTIIKKPLQFPIYLETTRIDSDFFRRQSDTLALDIIIWFDKNSIYDSNGIRRYVPQEILTKNKIYLDGYEITSMELSSSNSEYITIYTDYMYNLNDPMKVLQYKNTSALRRGIIDIM
jgi:hypothetical protein